MSRGEPLRVLCWDHPRCVGPLRSAAAEWHRSRPDRPPIAWDIRPLASFNDDPIDKLATQWDLLFIDHPAVGDCVDGGILQPLDDLLAPETFTDWEQDSVGLSHASYVMDSHVWAFAVDAACQTSVHRPDLMSAMSEAVPATWSDVRDLAQRRPGRVAWPLYPTDALLSLVSMTAGLQGTAGDLSISRPELLVAEEAVSILINLLPHLHPASLLGNPPTLLTLMATTEEIVYMPLSFCYADFQRPQTPNRLVFGAPPASGDTVHGSVLGGAGLAVSACSGQRNDAAEFAAWFASRAVQREIVPFHGGQPGRASAWFDAQADAASGGFFSAVLPVIQGASLRPRSPGWPSRQAAAGVVTSSGLRSGLSAQELAHAVRGALADVPRSET